MIRHLVKLVWRRKRAGALVMAEILLSFLVVFAVTTSGMHFWTMYHRPLGFDPRGLLRVQIDPELSEGAAPEETNAVFRRLLEETRALPEVDSAALMMNAPYEDSTTTFGSDSGGRLLFWEECWATEDLDRVLRLELLSGRWLAREDAALGYRAVVIDELLARDLFGDDDPLGKRIPLEDAKDDRRVVGLIRSFRRSGEFSTPRNFMFRAPRMGERGEAAFRGNLMVRLRSGEDGVFEERLMRLLRRVAPTWTFEATPLEQNRETYLRTSMTPLLTVGLVGGFLIIMVGLGLTGVLWQNVTQRTREIGLRRAAGAAAGDIHRQVQLELLILSLLGVSVGVVLVVQIPLLDLIGFVGAGTWLSGVVSAVTVICALSAVCAWYPSRLATRVPPAEALHYE